MPTVGKELYPVFSVSPIAPTNCIKVQSDQLTCSSYVSLQNLFSTCHLSPSQGSTSERCNSHTHTFLPFRKFDKSPKPTFLPIYNPLSCCFAHMLDVLAFIIYFLLSRTFLVAQLLWSYIVPITIHFQIQKKTKEKLWTWINWYFIGVEPPLFIFNYLFHPQASARKRQLPFSFHSIIRKKSITPPPLRPFVSRSAGRPVGRVFFSLPVSRSWSTHLGPESHSKAWIDSWLDLTSREITFISYSFLNQARWVKILEIQIMYRNLFVSSVK